MKHYIGELDAITAAEREANESGHSRSVIDRGDYMIVEKTQKAKMLGMNILETIKPKANQ